MYMPPVLSYNALKRFFFLNLLNSMYYFGIVIKGYGLFLCRLIGSAMFGATFNLVTRVGLPYFLNTNR